MMKISQHIKTRSAIQYLILMVSLIVNISSLQAQVKVPFKQRTSAYTPNKKIYNVKGDFTILGNTNLTPQNYSNTTNNNGQFMQYVDIDNDPQTWNSSSANLAFSSENGANQECSEIVFAGLYWTGKSANTDTFVSTKQVPNGTQQINVNSSAVHNQNIANTNFTLSITRKDVSPTDRSPIYTFSGNGNTYTFYFANNTPTVTLSVNGASAAEIPVTVSVSGNNATAHLITPYVIADGAVNLTISDLTRNVGTNLTTTEIQNTAVAEVNVSGSVPAFATISKNYDKRVISLKGPNATSYTQFTATESDIYYPNLSDGNIYSSFTEITDYVRSNGTGTYFAADIALLEGDNPGTGYSGGWAIIVVYENYKMKQRDVTIFDGYAYVSSSNTTGFTLPVSGFNTVQTGNVALKLGLIASEGDVAYSGDYFQIQKNSDSSYLSLSHANNTTTNFFNSSIMTPDGIRNPSLQNNTGIDISMFNVPNPDNTVIGNNQTATNFKYGTTSDTYSIFAIAMSVDSYIPNVEVLLAVENLNGNSITAAPSEVQPGDLITYKVEVKNPGTEAINNTKFIIELPYTATFVEGSLVKNIYFNGNPTPDNYYFDPALGPNGSIVWDFGTLPLPADPNTVLADYSFKLKATQDCTVIKNTICNPTITVAGFTSGTGAVTGANFSNTPMITGYDKEGACQGKPVHNPLVMNIDSAAFTAQNCQNNAANLEISICTANTGIPVGDISSNFQSGTLFYSEYPVTATTIQYSASNPFPSTVGTATYYAVVSNGSNGCSIPFNLNVSTITAVPTVTNVEYCLNTAAQPLSASPSDPAHILYYYTSINGTAQTQIIPATTAVGQITYYVSEAASANCIGPKVPVTVNVVGQPLVTPPANQAVQGCSINDLPGLVYSETAVAISMEQFTSNGGTVSSANQDYSISYTDTKTDTNPIKIERTYTVTSPCGNSAYVQHITIKDTEAPVIPVLENISGGCSITFSAPTTTDSCAGTIVGTTTDELSYSTQGEYSVTWTFDDGNGNQSTVVQKGTVTNSVETIRIESNLADCNIDNGLFIDLMKLLPEGISTAGTWEDTDQTNGLNEAVFSPYHVPVGDYTFRYTVPMGDCDATVELKMTVGSDCMVLPCGNIIVHNAFSPNGDSFNEVFEIENIENFSCYPTNSVEIYNRWGALVFQTKQYDNNTRAFRGISENSGTVSGSAGLPAGTYFYILQYTTSEGKTNKKDGYVYLSR